MFGIYGALYAIGLAPLGEMKKPALVQNKTFLQKAKRDRAWLLMMLLPFAFYVVFHYVPIYGMVIAFKDFSIPKGIAGSRWVGFKWFIQFFKSFFFFRLLRNTFLMSFYSLIFGFPVPILFALVLNEVRILAYKRIVQTVSYLPHFISTVVIVGIMVNFLSPNGGLVNVLLQRLGYDSINFMSEIRWFRPLFIGSGI